MLKNRWNVVFFLTPGIFLLAWNILIASPATEYTSDLSKNWGTSTATREKVSLNGIWQFQPLAEFPVGPTDVKIAGEWGYSKVPGSWKDKQFEVWEPSGNITSKWQGKEITEYKSGLYRREFTLPAGWEKKKGIFLQLMDVQPKGYVFLNGEYLGECEWLIPAEFDITRQVKTGGNNELMVVVTAVPGELDFLHSGITDDVYLETKETINIQDIHIMTSVRDKRLDVEVELSKPAPPGKEYNLAIKILDNEGKTAKELKKAVHSEDGCLIKFSEPWQEPRLWSLEEPYLYRINAQVSEGNQLVDAPYEERLGFREMWIEGRNFYLNGKRLFMVLDSNLSPWRSFYTGNSEEYLRSHFRIWKEQNVQGSRLFADNKMVCTSRKPYDIADEAGVIFDAPLISPLVYDDPSKIAGSWSNPEYRQRYEKKISAYIKRFRNHPSLLFWNLDFYVLHYVWRNQPLKLSDYTPQSAQAQNSYRMWTEMAEMAQKYDPTRTIYCYASGNLGPINTMFHFGNIGTPLQETENWPSDWAKRGKNPLAVVETGFPAYLFLNSEKKVINPYASERLDVEYAAMLFGESGYDLAVKEEMEKNTLFNTAYAKIRTYFVDRMVRPWRTYGVPGIWPHAEFMYGWTAYVEPDEKFTYKDLTTPGAKPYRKESYEGAWVPIPTGLNDYGKYLAKAFSPFVFYVGGYPEATSKEHGFFEGETIKKRAVCLNDSFQDASFKMEIRVSVSSTGKAIYTDKKDVTVKQGEKISIPIEFPAPDIQGLRDNLEIKLSVSRDAKEIASDIFKCEVFDSGIKKGLTTENKTVILFDSKGSTQKGLDLLGIKYKKLAPDVKPEDGDLLVVGKNSLADFNSIIQKYRLAERLTKGINILWFEQGGEKTAAAFPFPLNERSTRDVFIQVKDHPVLKGLQEEDFRNWRGDSDMTEPYPEPDPSTEYSNPSKFWKWGNDGIVSTYMFDKPCFGSFVSILESGFDLRETPLVEYTGSTGNNLLFCQLDISSRVGIDPAATLLFQNLIEYAGHNQKNRAVKVNYFGGDYTKEILERLYLPFTRLEKLEGITTDILILDKTLTSEEKTKIENFLKGGGTVVCLPFETSGEIVPGLNVNPQEVYRAKPSVNFDYNNPLKGISISDLFFKKTYPLGVSSGALADKATIKSEPNVISVIPYPEGKIIVCTVDPKKIGENRAQPKAYRILSRLFTNLGVILKDGFVENGEFLAGSSDIDLAANVWKMQIDIDNGGFTNKWHKPEYDDSGWKTVKVPSYVEDYFKTVNPGFSKDKDYDQQYQYDGYFWYRCWVKIPEECRDSVLKFEVGAIDDIDWVYLNGKQIGKTGKETPNSYMTQRLYPIPAPFVSFGKENLLAIKVLDDNQKGGLTKLPVKIRIQRPIMQKYYLKERYEIDDPYMWYPY